MAGALDEIESQTNYSFIYDAQVINLSEKVRKSLSGRTVFEILNLLFKNTEIVYTVMNDQIILNKKEAPMELSKRLQAVADLVTEGASVADIGTDHGYIPIYLIEHNIAGKVIALDINRGPLERARMHVVGHGLKGKIETRLSDGLEKVLPGEVDTMIAAGMGGGLVIKILTEGYPVVEILDTMILQPQSEIGKVRRFLNEHNLQITEENMVEEDGKFYPMMKVIHGKKEEYTICEYTYGKRLLLEQHPVLKKYLDREMQIKESVFQQLFKHQNSASAAERMEELKQEIILTQEALKYYE